MKRMMKAVAIALVGWLAVGAIQAQNGTMSAEKLFAAAQHKESTEGDLRGAVELYRQVATANGASRRLAARAVLATGSLFQRLGDVTQAGAAFETVVSRYADQTEIASEARRQLAALRPAATVATGPQATTTGLRTERVFAEPSFNGAFFRVSASGRYAAKMVQGPGGGPVLGLHEIATGNVRQLAVPAVDERANVAAAVISPDDQYVAYKWQVPGRSMLRVISTVEGANAQPRTISDNPEIFAISPVDWSGDGRLVSVLIRRRDQTTRIGVVTVADGTLRELKSVDWTGVGGLRFSPDGAWLAYHRVDQEGNSARDVFLLAVNASTERAAMSGVSDDTVLEWTSDGRLLVGSDRGGSMGVWSVQVRNGSSSAPPVLVNPQIGDLLSIGLTKAGTLSYRVPSVGANVWVAPFDVAAGRLTSAPTQPVVKFRGFNSSPIWSPDGKELAFLSIRGIPPFEARMAFVIQSLEAGGSREIHPAVSYLFLPKWSPDGRWIIGAGRDLKGRYGVFKVDMATGQTTLAAPSERCQTYPYWSADGKSFFCVDPAGRHIVEVDVASGETRRSFPGTSQGSAASPDGQYMRVRRPSRGASRPAAADARDRGITGACCLRHRHRARQHHDHRLDRRQQAHRLCPHVRGARCVS